MTAKLPTLYLIPLSRAPVPPAGAPSLSSGTTKIEWGYDLVDSSGNVHSTHWNVEGYHPAVITCVKVEGYNVVQFVGPPTHVNND